MNSIAPIFGQLIRKGVRTLDQVPAKYKVDTCAWLVIHGWWTIDQVPSELRTDVDAVIAAETNK